MWNKARTKPGNIPLSGRKANFSRARSLYTHNFPKVQNAISGANGKPLPSIKPITLWEESYRKRVKAQDERNRSHIFNLETAREVVKSLRLDVGPPKTVVQAYPGPGVVTRALLELPPTQLERLVLLEGNDNFFTELEAISLVDDRASLIKGSAFNWQTYTTLDQEGHLSHVPKQDWNTAHSSLRWLAHLPDTVHSEQLISQLIRYIPERVWLWSHGRVELDLLLSLKLWNRVIATPKQATRCRLSVISQSLMEFEEVLPRSELVPAEAHIQHATRGRSVPVVLSRLVPKERSPITQDSSMAWDFVIRSLFIQKRTPLSKAIRNLSPGATVLLDKLSEVIDIEKDASSMTEEEFGHIVKAVQEWPFAPEMSSTVSVAELREMGDEL